MALSKLVIYGPADIIDGIKYLVDSIYQANRSADISTLTTFVTELKEAEIVLDNE